MQCPCGSGHTYEECCGPYIEGKKKPETAEALMRSRYTAFATQAVDYILDTHDPSNRGDLDRNSTAEWSKRAEWLGFELLNAEGGGGGDDEGKIEFVARYRFKGDELAHHETATFRKHEGVWYFVDGEMATHETFVRTTAKVGRNEPCPCGSGKKYKKCCG